MTRDEAVKAAAQAMHRHLPRYHVEEGPGFPPQAVMDEDCPGDCGWESYDAGYPDVHLAALAVDAVWPVIERAVRAQADDHREHYMNDHDPLGDIARLAPTIIKQTYLPDPDPSRPIRPTGRG